MADAALSVAAAGRPIAAITTPVILFSAGQNVTLDASTSAAACGSTIASYSWSVTSPATNPPPLAGAGTALVSLTAPAGAPVTLHLTVTDDQGRTDATDVVVNSTGFVTGAPTSAGTGACAPTTSSPPPGGSTPPPVTPPPTTNAPPLPKPKNGGSGGGGSFELLSLTLLGAILALRLWRSRRIRVSRCI
jgi:hypothetical protein